MLNKAAFDKMRDGVFIVNASRGPLIDEQALIDALDSGKLPGRHWMFWKTKPKSLTTIWWART